MALAIVGEAMPPGSLVAQQGKAMQQSIMQFIGHEQHAGHMKHGFMSGRQHFIGQSTILGVWGGGLWSSGPQD